MKKWRRKGNKLYKQGIEPLELIFDNGMGKSFCLGSIIKYAARASRKRGNGLVEDLDKIIHYAEILKEELCQSQKCTESHLKTKSTSEEETK